MENDVWKLVRSITTNRFNRETLNEKKLRLLVATLRSDNTQYQTFFTFLQRRAESTSSQTRFLTLHLAHYFFTRSAHFRSVVCHSYLYGFLVNFYKDLPEPFNFADKIRMSFPIILSIWCDDFKKFYPQLASLKNQFPLIKEELNDTQKKIKRRAKLLLNNYKKEFDPLLNEIQRLSALLVVPESGEYSLDDEYVSVIVDEIKSYKKVIENCLEQIKWLDSLTGSSQKGTDLGNEIDKFIERAKIAYNTVVQYEDDDFEDIDDEYDE